MIHLFPLWSTLSNGQRTEDGVKPFSNAIIESHFKTVKHGTLQGKQRLRPREFFEKQLVFIQGRLNETHLPAVPRQIKQRAKQHMLQDEPEIWERKRRRQSSYADKSTARKVLKVSIVAESRPSKPEARDNLAEDNKKKNSVVGNKVISEECCNVFAETSTAQNQNTLESVLIQNRNEIGDIDVNRAIRLMQNCYGNAFGGLNETGMGTYTPGKCMPRFSTANGVRFVQVLNIGDHWICVTNIFGKTTHDVYIYDSLYESISNQVIVMTTSLLRDEDTPDTITFSIRKFRQQSQHTRICGFFAVAAAFSCCEKIDPTGIVYDESLMAEHLQKCFNEEKVQVFPGVQTQCKSVFTRRLNKLHCFCQQQSRGNMIQCSYCLNWLHVDCVGENQTITKPHVVWLGPCCDHEFQGRSMKVGLLYLMN